MPISSERRWLRRPDSSNWGDFGPDDQLGRLNFITAESRIRAAKEIVEGRAFCLSLPLDCPRHIVLHPRRVPPQLSPTMRGNDPVLNYPMSRVNSGQTDIVSDDRAALCLQYSTQWDSLAHVGSMFDAQGNGELEAVYYNGYQAGIHVHGPFDYVHGRVACEGPYGAHALGIENMAATCVQGRGVLIDLFRHIGLTRQSVGYEDLMKILESDRITVERGDILCVRTGFDRALLARYRDRDAPFDARACCGLNGDDSQLLSWISDSGAAAIVSDNEAVELLPDPQSARLTESRLPLHEHCIFKIGLPLGELFLLSDLADWLRERERSHFFFTAPPLRLPGAFGSPVTPVATV